MRALLALLLAACSSSAPAVGAAVVQSAVQHPNTLTVTVNPGNTPPQTVVIDLTPPEMSAIENGKPFAIAGNGVMFTRNVSVNVGIVP